MTRRSNPARRPDPAAKTSHEVTTMSNIVNIALPVGPTNYADKATLAESGAQFIITAVADGAYNGKPQYDLTIVDSDDDEAVLTLGAGGSRDTAITLVRNALAGGAEGVGPFILVAFETKFGKPGYALANV